MVWIIFTASSIVLVAAAVKLAQYGDVVAVRTRLGGMFIGVLLLAAATSLPELLTMINSFKEQAPSLAAGNLFGSNVFNMMALGITDGFYVQGLLFNDINTGFALAGLIVLLLLNLALSCNLANLEWRLGFVELDALLIILTFIGGLFLLYQHGVGM